MEIAWGEGFPGSCYQNVPVNVVRVSKVMTLQSFFFNSRKSTPVTARHISKRDVEPAEK
jgi:hypothetical protein